MRERRAAEGAEEGEVRWKWLVLLGIHFLPPTSLSFSSLHSLLTADLKNRLVEVEGHQGLWQLSKEHFDENSCQMRISVCVQINIVTYSNCKFKYMKAFHTSEHNRDGRGWIMRCNLKQMQMSTCRCLHVHVQHVHYTCMHIHYLKYNSMHIDTQALMWVAE